MALCDINGYHFRFALEECKKLNPSTKGIEITSTINTPPLEDNYDFIYCYAVLEHIPNSLQVVKFLCEHLENNRIFLETYGGRTGDIPDDLSADSKSAWDQRDKCFDYLYSSKNLIQVCGKKLIKENDGHYPQSKNFRCWQRIVI